MDEPTNHLDIWSREALERSINEFEGTVLVVSHDRYFLNKVADRLVVIRQGQSRVIEGDYETYLHLEKEQDRGSKSPTKTTATTTGSAGTSSRPTTKPTPSTDKPKRKFAYRKATDVEREIGELEQEVRELEDLLGQPATWRDPVKAVRFQDRHTELKTRLETLYQHWETALEANW
jgi:ATP-binding cassette subfamily F protein 3